MGALFIREAAVYLDSVRVTGLRIRFTVKKNLKKEPNTAEIRVTNLSQAHRSIIRERGAQIVVQAGYQGQSAVIFGGNARTVDHVREGSEWTTIAQCGDGEEAYLLSRVSQAFGAGTAQADILSTVVKKLGINEGNFRAKIAGLTKQFTQGFVASGRAATVLDKLLASNNLTWSVQDGKLQILGPDESIDPAAGAVVLTPDTGLIGSPEHGIEGRKNKKRVVLKCKCLLNPRLKCGGLVEIHANNAQGMFKIRALEHEGDSWSGDWFTLIEAVPFKPQ